MTDKAPFRLETTRWRQAAPWLAACILALGAGAVHQWQTTRIGVLGDFAYVVDTAWRIVQGEVMYRDFVLPHSPLTFHVQATLMKLFGFSYRLTVWYCTVVNVAYVLLTYRLLRLLLPPWSAVGLCAPLVWLAPHCIYPHPFYDPDACLLMLLNLSLLHWVTMRPVSGGVTLLCGMTTVLPALAKQNVGYPYVALVGVWVMWWGWLRELWGGGEGEDGGRGARWFMYGLVGGGLAVLGWLGATCGVENYVYWVFVSASRRLARLTIGETYGDGLKWAQGLLLVGGWWLWRVGGVVAGVRLARVGAVLLVGPFVGVVALVFLTRLIFPDLFDHPVLWLWLPVMLLALAAGVWRGRGSVQEASPVTAMLPWLCLTVTFCAFLSQTHTGSSYGIWALFFLMLGCGLSGLPEGSYRAGVTWVVAALMMVGGMSYVQRNVRLRYVDRNCKQFERFLIGPLRGLTTCAPYLSDFVELVTFAEERIPPEDRVACIPQEEPFYVMTGRRNPLRVVVFDRTANPLSPEELVEEALRRQVTWVILKQRPQMKIVLREIEGVPEAFVKQYQPVAQLGGYIVLHKTSP